MYLVMKDNILRTTCLDVVVCVINVTSHHEPLVRIIIIPVIMFSVIFFHQTVCAVSVQSLFSLLPLVGVKYCIALEKKK